MKSNIKITTTMLKWKVAVFKNLCTEIKQKIAAKKEFHFINPNPKMKITLNESFNSFSPLKIQEGNLNSISVIEIPYKYSR